METLKICAPGKLSQNVVRVVKIICKPVFEEAFQSFASPAANVSSSRPSEARAGIAKKTGASISYDPG
jgi:hypothetical protein